MRRIVPAFAAILLLFTLQAAASDKKENSVTSYPFIQEKEMMEQMMQMIARSMDYAQSIFTQAGNNEQGDTTGYFKANSAGRSNEDGVRTNADFSFLCAFLCRFGEDVKLPEGISRERLQEMAVQSLTYAYSTHRSLQLQRCTDGRYWGSSPQDADGGRGGITWESSLWAQSVAFAAWLLDDRLDEHQKAAIKTLIMAEADAQLPRTIPTGYIDDTKAEENGWDTNILACAAALYPDEPNAPQWWDKCCRFAINTYSVAADREDTTTVDGRRVCDLHIGANLYDDYTLENHGFFHTSYQNIAIQELSESYLAFACMQPADSEAAQRFKAPEALRHNVQKVFDEVLKELALCDGELAMPNGNDWSMYLYDQLASYSAMACLYRDADALMLENRAFVETRARQATTTDGSWMLNSDIGPRRMGVTGRRVAMAWLYHHYFTTCDLTPTTWDAFAEAHSAPKHFPHVNVVRSLSPERALFFSWAKSKKSYTGMIGANNPRESKIIIPYRKGNSGNFLGSYQVEGKRDNIIPVVAGDYQMCRRGFVMNSEVTSNDHALTRQITLAATPGNAVIYLERAVSNEPVTITGFRIGTMGVSTDPFTRTKRALYNEEAMFSSRGDGLQPFESQWVNIDNEIGIVAKNHGNRMAFGEKELLNSIQTSKIYSCFGEEEAAAYGIGEEVACRNVVYYTNIDANTTRRMASQVQVIDSEGWYGALVPEPCGSYNLVVSAFAALHPLKFNSMTTPLGAPLLKGHNRIEQSHTTTTLQARKGQSYACEVIFFVKAKTIEADCDEENQGIYLYNPTDQKQKVTVTAIIKGEKNPKKLSLKPKESVRLKIKDDELRPVLR